MAVSGDAAGGGRAEYVGFAEFRRNPSCGRLARLRWCRCPVTIISKRRPTKNEDEKAPTGKAALATGAPSD